MPRRARVELEGGIHHVTLRGNRGAPIFLDDRDRRFLVAELDAVADRYAWTWLAYCLMGNHAHLVIETPERTLGLGMRQLAGRHAQVFNRRHETYGHMFQERYGSVLVRSEAQFAQLLRYVALNPVKAGLCTDAAHWPWSSHPLMLRQDRRVARASARVESLLEVWGGKAGSRYARLFDPAGPLAARFGDESPWTARPPLAELLSTLGLDDGMRAAREHGYRLADIAAAVGLHEATVSRRTRRRARTS
jgi:putative transposase